MITENWLYDVIIYIYALSLLFYFSDIVSKNDGAKRMGAGLLVFVWLLQTLFFFIRMYEHRYIPVLTMFEVLFFFSWLLVTASLVASRFIAMGFVVFFVNVFGFTILAINLLSDPGGAPLSESTGELLMLHVALAIFSYAAFSLSAVLSGLYLFLYGRLKGKKWSFVLKRIPSLDSMERQSTLLALAGVPVLILSLSIGFVWSMITYETVLAVFSDFKVYATLLVLASYGWLLVLKKKHKAPGNRLAVWNLACFAVLLANFGLSNFVSSFH